MKYNSDSERKKPIKKKRTVRNDYKKRGIKKTKSLDKINRKNEGSWNIYMSDCLNLAIYL